ncbi:ABC transporter substrate-binding protein [Chachezhania sediminis]|uniref:ABC transporter substrate-binding protein n=1 Tax=Chachezhania sediminis TaxID=2599291 RepID=UPI00131E25CB|nr:ABC transporter substrate-binding protein [Chachezhania sediminis]
MPINQKLLDLLRKGRSAHENHLIDGLIDGRVSRREFLRHGSVLGLSATTLAAVTGAAGFELLSARRAFAAPGGTIRVGQIVPAAVIEPVSVADSGGITVLSQVAETLVLSGSDLTAQPLLAESWFPNEDGSVWTFKLRPNVKFHSGKVMNADDVVATFERLADPENASNALSALKGVLSKGGTRKVDDLTVEFHLDAPNGGFPYTVSTDNYNAVILPADYDGDFEKDMNGTGPFKLVSYTPKVGAVFERNPDYWGDAPLPDRIELHFYDDYQPQILALQAGDLDVMQQVPVLQGIALLHDPNVTIISTPSSAHQQVHMRTDSAPFADKRVRQAVALCLDRPGLVQGLMQGKAVIGNDSPFMPAFPATDHSIPQREKDLAKAKELLDAAGGGFEVTLTTEKYLEIPQYAQLIQAAVREIGIDMKLNIMDQGAYYGEAVPGNSPWLDSVMGITDYGHRGVPNVFLQAPLLSTGTWNSAHFNNSEYDTLVASYIAALDLEAQKETASKIQTLLLDETPIIDAYFYDYLTPTKAGVTGVEPTAMGHLFLQRASL